MVCPRRLDPGLVEAKQLEIPGLEVCPPLLETQTVLRGKAVGVFPPLVGEVEGTVTQTRRCPEDPQLAFALFEDPDRRPYLWEDEPC
jgi:hypothetical protein